jgi:hypothetical protein
MFKPNECIWQGKTDAIKKKNLKKQNVNVYSDVEGVRGAFK